MADLSFLEANNELTAIDKMIKSRRDSPRRYLGMSEIGDPCSRKLWLRLHTDYEPQFNGRMLRLFRAGHQIEKLIIADLRNAGYPVFGCQKKYQDFNGMFKGHPDGFIKGLEESDKLHVLEIKSASDKNFKLFKKTGIQDHSIYGAKYHAQVQCYMGYSGLDRTLFIVENKDTSERYRERIRFNKKEFDQLRTKAQQIIEFVHPPKGLSPRADWYQCRFCDFNNEEYCRRQWQGEGAF